MAYANNVWPTSVALIAIIGTVAQNVWLTDPSTIVGSWIATLVAMIIVLACIGTAIRGRFLGVIIDVRNRVSLSKTQAVAWTVLTLSALVAFATVRARLEMDVLGVELPQELLVAMGISAASLVTTPAVLSLKTTDNPTAGQEASASEVGMKSVDGLVAGRDSPAGASWLDMFRGDETGNASSVDLSKVQQFFVTAILIAVYAGMIGDALDSHTAESLTFPDFDERIVWLLGISHAGYITYKAVPHSGAGASATGGEKTSEAVG